MLYRPPDSSLWDTFLMRHEDWFHLFHLRGSKPLGHARSRDLLHWEVRPTIDLCGPPGSWNEDGAYLTGCIVRHGNEFRMLSGGPGLDTISRYGLFASDDLDHWRQVCPEPVLSPRAPLYHDGPSNLACLHAAWRDPCVVELDGWYHGFLCARTPDYSAHDTGAVVAHVRSQDLENWEHLPPLAAVGDRLLFAEVPDVFRMGDWWYVLFLDHGWGGTRMNSPSRTDMAGTFYMKSRSLEGPYEWPQEPLLIGTSDDRMGPWAARTLGLDDERWLYFHNAGGGGATFGLPKRIQQTDSGDLWLSYLALMEPIECPVELNLADAVRRMKPQDHGQWQQADGKICGCADAAGTAVIVAESLPNGRFTCRVRSEGAARAGMVLRSEGPPGTELFEQANRGLVVWLDFELQQLAAEQLAWVPGFGWGRCVHDQMGHARDRSVAQRVACKLPEGEWVSLRVVFRDRCLEAYLGDRWMLSLNTGEHPQSGRIELTVERGQALFDSLSLASLPPLSDAVKDEEPGD